MRKWLWLIAGVVLVVGVVVGWLLAHRIAPTDFSRLTSNVHYFTPYYFSGMPPNNFILDKSSLNYQNNVLIFSLKNSKDYSKTLVFTEQKTPTGFDTSSLESDKEFKTTYGQAFITDGTLRTTGALFTDDKTWILINAPDAIGADTMRTILNSLQPTH